MAFSSTTHQHEKKLLRHFSITSKTSSETTEFETNDRKRGSKQYHILLGINYLFLFIGSVSSSLLAKFYFNHKGSSRWVSTLVQSAGFPLLIPPVYVPYHVFRSTRRRPFSGFTPGILTASVIIGLLLGLNNLLISWGSSYLPVSTNSLLLSTQLVFTLLTSMVIVKQKVNFANLNCVVLLTLSSVLLALNSGHDKPEGLTRAKFFIGFFSTIGAGLLFALYLPVMEKLYSNVNCYAMVVEMQLVMEMAATVFAAVGMAASGGFGEMRAEMERKFDLGPTAYCLAVGFNLITWQLCFVGTAGMVFLTTSLTGGICMTALMAINVVGGVVVFGDHFGGAKAISTALCVWGFCSYVYGMYVKAKAEHGGEGDGDGDGEEVKKSPPLTEMTEIVTDTG